MKNFRRLSEGLLMEKIWDKKRFVQIAQGSAFELETQLLIIRDLSEGLSVGVLRTFGGISKPG